MNGEVKLDVDARCIDCGEISVPLLRWNPFRGSRGSVVCIGCDKRPVDTKPLRTMLAKWHHFEDDMNDEMKNEKAEDLRAMDVDEVRHVLGYLLACDSLERHNGLIEEALTAFERVARDRIETVRNLTVVQARCSELLEEVRQLRSSRVDEQVRAFHRLIGVVDQSSPSMPEASIQRLRLRLVLEEAFELVMAHVSRPESEHVRGMLDATFDFIDCCDLEPDIVEIADALADIDYVVAGTRLQYGIDQESVAAEVHKSNMNKAPGGAVLRDNSGKVRKPPGWKPPDVARVLGQCSSRSELSGLRCTLGIDHPDSSRHQHHGPPDGPARLTLVEQWWEDRSRT